LALRIAFLVIQRTNTLHDRPYDAFVITAQILSIPTIFLSCLSWIGFIISLVGVLPFQMLWCRRQHKSTLSTLALIAGVCSVTFFSFGIYYTIDTSMFCNHDNLYVFLLESYGANNRVEDHCPTHIWAGLSFSCGVLWALAMGCILYFIKSGRYAKFEEIHNKNHRRKKNKHANGDASITIKSKIRAVVELKTIPESHASMIESHSFSDSLSEMSFSRCSDVSFAS